MIHFGRRLDALDIGNHVQSRGLSDAVRMQRNGSQILDGSNLRLRVLNGQEIIVPIARVDPEIRSDHLVGSKRSDDVGQHFAFGQAELRSVQAIDIHAQGRIIQILRHENVGDGGRQPQLGRNVLSHPVIGIEVRSNHLHVNRGGRAHADHGIH